MTRSGGVSRVAKGADCKSAAVWLRRFESFFPHHPCFPEPSSKFYGIVRISLAYRQLVPETELMAQTTARVDAAGETVTASIVP